MHLLSGIHSNAKPMALFLLVMLGILGSSIVEKHLMREATTSVSSLFQDRLLPATGLFEVNDLMYDKRQLLEKHLAEPALSRHGHDLARLAKCNQHIQAIIERHQATYLVAEEKLLLREFLARLHRYNALETELMVAANPPTAVQMRATEQQFYRVHADLRELNQLQLSVGQNLSQDSVGTESTAELLSTLKIALLVVFTVAIQYALLSSRHPLVPKGLQNFRLN